MYSYTRSDILSINNNRRWNNSINTKEIDNSNSNKNYKLYATGDADASGRKYIALPTKLTVRSIKKNILKGSNHLNYLKKKLEKLVFLLAKN